MKIFLTGGAGFIGKYLIKKLQNQHEIIVYENFSNSSEEDFSNLLKKLSLKIFIEKKYIRCF
jgi:nucleoside-diphosphate-sugar epimerase